MSHVEDGAATTTITEAVEHHSTIEEALPPSGAEQALSTDPDSSESTSAASERGNPIKPLAKESFFAPTHDPSFPSISPEGIATVDEGEKAEPSAKKAPSASAAATPEIPKLNLSSLNSVAAGAGIQQPAPTETDSTEETNPQDPSDTVSEAVASAEALVMGTERRILDLSRALDQSQLEAVEAKKEALAANHATKQLQVTYDTLMLEHEALLAKTSASSFSSEAEALKTQLLEAEAANLQLQSQLNQAQEARKPAAAGGGVAMALSPPRVPRAEAAEAVQVNTLRFAEARPRQYLARLFALADQNRVGSLDAVQLMELMSLDGLSFHPGVVQEAFAAGKHGVVRIDYPEFYVHIW